MSGLGEERTLAGRKKIEKNNESCEGRESAKDHYWCIGVFLVFSEDRGIVKMERCFRGRFDSEQGVR